MSRLIDLLTKHSFEDEFLTTLEMHEFIDLLVEQHQNHPTPPPCDPCNPSALEAVAIVNAIDTLRSVDGVLSIGCKFNTISQILVTVNDDWTVCRDESFVGDSLLEALTSAVAERNRRIEIMSGRQNADSTQS